MDAFNRYKTLVLTNSCPNNCQIAERERERELSLWYIANLKNKTKTKHFLARISSRTEAAVQENIAVYGNSPVPINVFKYDKRIVL